MGTKNQTTTTQQTPNPAAGAAYNSLLQRASGVAETPYQSYSGELVAPVNAQQNLGIGNINQGAGFAQPYIQQAAQYANNAAQPLTAEDIARYSDPYTQQVINATEGQFAHDNAVQQQGVLGNAAAQGALGGNRVGVAQALTAEGQQRAQAPVIAGLRSQGYNTGLNTAMNQQQQQAQAAYSLGNLGTAGQNAYLTGANAQIGAGTLQQGTQQALNAANYGQFTQAQAFPYQQAQWLAGIDTGVGSQMGGTSETTKPGPNLLTQLGGLGVAATGAFMGNPMMIAGGAGMMGGGGGGGSPGYYGGSPASNANLNPASFGNLQNPYSNPYVARGGRIEGFDSGGAVVPYGGVGMPYAGAGPSWMPQAQITHGRGMAGVAGGMEDAPSSPGVAKIMSDATMLARKFMSQPGGQAFGGAVSPPSSDSIMLPRGYQVGGTPTMAGFGSGSMVPQDFNMFDPNPTPTGGFPPEDRPPSQWGSGKLQEVPFDPASFAPGTFGMATPEDQPPDPYIGGRDEAYRAAMAAAGDDPYGAIEARAGVGDTSPEAPAAGVGNTGGWSSGIGPALMSAGFGMMASQSPHIGTAIGEGGLAGLKTYTEGQQRDVANRRAEATMARQDAQTNIQQKGLDLRVNELKQRALQAQEALKAQTQRQQETLKSQKERQQEALKAQQENRTALQKQHEEDQAEKRRQFDIQQKRNPPQWRTKEDGTLEAVPGGQHDPATIKAEAEAKQRASTMSDEALRAMVETYRAGNTASVLSSIARGAQGPANLERFWNMLASDLAENGATGKDLAAAKANFTSQSAAASVAAKREANVASSVEEARATFPLALEASKAVPRGQFVPFNQLMNMVREKTSSPEQARLAAALNGSMVAYAQAMSRTGVTSVNAQQHAEKLLSAAPSHEALQATLGQMELEMQAALTAPETVRKRILGNISGREESTKAGAAAPVRVTTPAEAQKLTPGTHYIGPDGQERIR